MAVGSLAVPVAASAHEGTASRTTVQSAQELTTIKLLAPQTKATTGGPEVNGTFSEPFAEPTIGGVRTDEKCLESNLPNKGALQGKAKQCKPAAGTLAILPNGKVFFWDALEGTENNQYSIVTEGGSTFTNDSARLLDLGKDNANPSWVQPKQFDGGANPNGDPGEPLIPGGQTTEKYNDGALFGSHQNFLPDGRILVQGGTSYSADPGVDGLPFGALELTGIKSTRIYDPKTNEFVQGPDTEARRWYPTLISTGDGTTLNLSGVGKLIKPVYPNRPADSGTNVKAIERYDPKANKWSLLPASADYDLPLYPRLHLLPNGKVWYNGSGQAFNPFGQSTGEANWLNLASFDPKTNKWTQHGLANSATPLAPGFRGSTTSTLLPLKPNADGTYTKADMLMAGGVIGPTPGSYIPTNQSSITSVDTSGAKEKVTQTATGPLAQARWFGQNILLPTGQVIVFSGADKDEVVGPGTEVPIQQSEIFDPEKKTWTPISSQKNPRTYHNSAVLLPSGEILVGGHATISTLYLNNTTLPGGFAPHDGRDPSFEVFKPPYMFYGDRPVIRNTTGLIGYGRTMDIELEGDASKVKSVALVRNSAITHIVDADQRTVMLPVIGRSGNVVTVQTPPDGNVAPPGPYMTFVNGETAKGLAPSVAKQVMVTADGAAADKAAVKAAGKRKCTSRRAFRVNVRKLYRNRVRSVTVSMNGKKVKTLKRGQKSLRISLKGQPKRVTVVKLKMKLRGGRTITDTRTYNPCIKGKKSKSKAGK